MSLRTKVGLLFAALTCASACSSGIGADPDGGIDSGSDTDTDADSDVDSDTDTVPDLYWDGGPLIDCSGEPEDGEVCIPGGTYLMGCMPYDTECEENEKPMVEVTLSPFFTERREAKYGEVIEFLNSLHDGYIREQTAVKKDDVSQTLIWSRGIDGWGYKVPPIGLNGDGDYEWGIGESDEEVCLGKNVNSAAGGFSWHGAKLYCELLGKSLPTEAQWEAAARGQTKLIWPCAWYHLPCWYGKYDCCQSGGECYTEACSQCCLPFPYYSAGSCDSQFGVEQMYGNAHEFVLDWLDNGHEWCAEGCTDPEPTEGTYPIIKGGSIRSDWERTRISYRNYTSSHPASPIYGVRCVRPDTPIEEDAGPDSGADSGE